MLGTIDNLNGLLTMNKIANIEVNVDELTTTSNLNGLLTFNLHYSPHLQPAQPKWFTHLTRAIAKTHTTPQYNKTKRIF
jgi:hypothetical protein